MAGLKIDVKTKGAPSAALAAALETLLEESREIEEFDIDVIEPKRTVKIKQDDCPFNPRTEYDNVGVMFCRHGRYILGDKDAENPFAENEETGEYELRDDIALCLPLYLYDHSGLTISHGSFSCMWDSGQVGWHYATKDAVQREWGGDLEKAQKYLEAELKEYDHYLRGNVWFFVVEDEYGDSVESCSGFIGDKLEETGILEHIDEELHEAAREAWEKRFD